MSDLGNLGSSGFMSSGNWQPPGSTAFPDPFCDMASLAMPETITYALRWAEFVTISNGTYFRALDRVLSYFITDIELIGSEDDEEKEEILSFLHGDFDLLNEIHIGGMNYMVYGNDFSTVLNSFRRYLSCPKCALEMPLGKIATIPDFKYKWSDYEFNAYCPKCQYSGAWKHIDRRSGEDGPIRMKHWSPHEIELLWDPFSDDIDYIWKIPEDYRQVIREGKLYHLERAPWEVIQAIKENKHLRFEKDAIYHMKESTLGGIRNRGWGISRVLSNFRQAWYVQVLHRYNEAIALDYVIPFRLITPAGGSGSQDVAKDALLNLNMGGYMNQVQRMLQIRRKDPAAWHTLPFPVEYKALGGDATQLAPRDLMDQGIEVLLNNVGVPVELYKGSLQIQSAPAALRLFESSWSHLVHHLNGYVRFIMKKLAEYLSWEKVSAKLIKVTHADDLNRQMAKMQLMVSDLVSKQTGLQSVGIDFFDEERRKSQEQLFLAEQQNKLQGKLDQAGQMAGASQPQQQGMPGDPSMQGGGMPAQPGSANVMAGQPTLPDKPTTPQEMMQKAQVMAQQILSMPESQKDSELINLKRNDPTLHSLVKSQIEDIRRQAQVVGGSTLMQQTFGKQGSSGDELGGAAVKKPKPPKPPFPSVLGKPIFNLLD